MKRRNMISFLLAFALVITAVPNEWIVRAPEAKAAGEQNEQQPVITIAENQLVAWDSNASSGDGTINADGTVKTTEKEYGSSYDFSYSGIPQGFEDMSELVLNEEQIREAFGVASGTVSVYSYDFDYQWYEVIAGKRNKLEGKTKKELNEEVNNKAKERTFVCEITLNGATIGGIDYTVEEDMQNPEAYGLSFERTYVMTYMGTVVDKSEVKDYFNGIDEIKDVTIRAHKKNDCYSYDDYIMEVGELSAKRNSSYFNYTWTVHLKGGKTKALDGNTKELRSGEHTRSLSLSEAIVDNGCQFYEVDGELKQVDYYECSVDLCYGYQVIDTVSKKYYFRYEPFYINGDGVDEETIEIRKNGTAQMEVKARIQDTEAIVPDTLSYQWYRIDADGNETKLNGETASSYTVRVPDASVKYRVDVTAQKKEGFDGPEFDEVLSRTYKFTSSDGYLLKDISYNNFWMNIGDEKKLYVKPQVDDGYTLEYKWEKVSYEKDEEGNYVYDEDYSRKIVAEELGTDNECEVKISKESDFDYISDYSTNIENNLHAYNYRVTVTVKKGDETVDTHVYAFGIWENSYISVEDKSDTRQELDPGDDLELYVKTEEKGGFTQEKIWYEEITSGPAVETTNIETKKTSYISADKEFEIPQKYDWAEQGAYVGYDNVAKASVYKYTFWKKVGEGESYKKSGKEGTTNVDVRGRYRLCLDVYRDSEMQKDEAERERHTWQYFDFTAAYDSDLSAYAKSRFPRADEGGKAKLRIVAQTKSDAYKINYKWEKHLDDGSYKELEDVTGATYEIDKAALSDAGEYRVTVSDEYGKKCMVPIWLSVAASDKPVESDDVTDVCFTPKNTVYRVGMDSEVKLKLDMKLSDKNTEVFYAWYRDERIKYDGDYYNTKENWELLGEDKDTYSLSVKSEDDFTRYKCLAVYRKNSTEYASREVYFDVRQAYSSELERMMPREQIKKLGDSASYSVRLITDEPGRSDNVVYQWYRYGSDGKRVDIDGATKESYQIDELGKDDFGRIYCEVKDKKTGDKIAEDISFTTRIYLNGAYLEKDWDEVEAEEGDEKTVVGPPEIMRKDGLELTYQWYRCGGTYTSDEDFDEDYDEDYLSYDTIIYGATDATYTIEDIGDNEFVTYRCEVYANGSYLDDYHATVVHKQEDDIQEEKAPIEVSVREGYETNVKAFLGSSAEFAVTAVSNRNLDLKYQWYFDGEAIGDAVLDSYKIDIVTSRKTGSYYCRVMDEEGNTARSETFTLTTTTGLDVETEGLNPLNAIGVQTTFGAQGVVLTATATASTEHGYTPFFQWYHDSIDDKGLIYGATTQVLTLPTIDEDALGMYYCVVQDSSGADYTLKYYVYVNNGLNVMPSTRNVVAQNGSAKMYVTATANAGCVISYQWSKWGEDEDGEMDYIDIAGATADVLTLSPVTSKDYGTYRCIVSTVGERNVYYFSLQPSYGASADREFARQGDVITVSAELENPAADYTYSYQWYEQEPVTGTYRKMKDGTAAVYAKTAPLVDLSEQYTDNDELGYVPVGYKCIVTISDGEEEWEKTVDAGVRVLPAFAYQTASYPETNHPNDKRFDIQAYQAGGAEALKLTFDAQTDLGDASLYLIDKTGKAKVYGYDELAGDTVTISGDSVVLLMNGNMKAKSFGYKVSSIEHVMPPQAAGQPGAAGTKGTGALEPVKSGSKAAVKKGNKYTVKNLVYKVTNTSGKKKAVTVVGAKSKKAKSITIPATVKISGAKYKVTAIASKAFQGYSKLKKVTIGKNVKKIGASAFAKDKKLTQLTVKGTTLKSVGKKAFTKVPKKAKVKVPKKSKKAYKKLFKKGAFKGKVK